VLRDQKHQADRDYLPLNSAEVIIRKPRAKEDDSQA
jgi:hypothetical protein